MNSFLAKERLTGEVIVLSQKENGGELELGKSGGGIEIPEFLHRTERYFTFHVKACEEHSLALHLLIYGKDPKEPQMTIRFGILPDMDTLMCIDREWFDAKELFPWRICREN